MKLTSKSPLNTCKYKRISDWKLQNCCHNCAGENCWNGDILTFAYQIVDVWCQGFLLSFLFFAALISIPLLPLHPYFLWRYYYFWQKGAIISLPSRSRGHSTTTWTKFYPMLTHSPHKNGHFTNYLPFFRVTHSGPTVDFHWPPPSFSCPRSYWMTPAGIKASISSVTHDMALQLLTFLNVVVVKLHDIFSIGVQH